MGNVELVVRRITGDVDENENQWYRGTRLYYTKDGHLWMSRAERWQYAAGEEGSGCENGPPPEGPPTGCPVTNCAAYAAMEYRYAGGRGRYMVRPLDPETMAPESAAAGQWFDHDGQEIYSDFSVSYDEQSQTVTATDLVAHEPGLAQYDNVSQALHHLHGNLIGTTERMTDAFGSIAHRAVYTAFGEPVSESGAIGTRYQYAGAWGYEQAECREIPDGQGGYVAWCDPLAELGWLHVGERYYDSSTGPFAQRDPIGRPAQFRQVRRQPPVMREVSRTVAALGEMSLNLRHHRLVRLTIQPLVQPGSNVVTAAHTSMPCLTLRRSGGQRQRRPPACPLRREARSGAADVEGEKTFASGEATRRQQCESPLSPSSSANRRRARCTCVRTAETDNAITSAMSR
jgi:hypothetical protein